MPPRRARTKVTADPSSPHESRPRTTRAATAGALILIAALALTACTGSGPDGGDFGDGDFADDGCTNVVIATSSEKVNMLDALAEAFKESPQHDALDECATVRPINVSSGEAGVREVVRNLLAELDITLGLSGHVAIADVGPDALRGV